MKMTIVINAETSYTHCRFSHAQPRLWPDTPSNQNEDEDSFSSQAPFLGSVTGSVTPDGLTRDLHLQSTVPKLSLKRPGRLTSHPEDVRYIFNKLKNNCIDYLIENMKSILFKLTEKNCIE